MSPEELPALPLVNISRVLARRDRVLALILEQEGVLLDAPNLDLLLVRLRRALRLRCDRSVLLDSVRYLAGRRPSEMDLLLLCWRLAGNWERLRDGRPTPPVEQLCESHWAPLECTQAVFPAWQERGGQRCLGVQMTWRVLSGLACPMEVERYWTVREADYLGEVVLGFARRRGALRMLDKSEIFGMRCFAWLDAERSQLGRLWFRQIASCPAFLDYNRDKMRLRARQGWDCPERYEHDCFVCHRGRESCPASTHSLDYQVRFCPGCQREWWFDADPRRRATHCIRCQSYVDANLSIPPLSPGG